MEGWMNLYDAGVAPPNEARSIQSGFCVMNVDEKSHVVLQHPGSLARKIYEKKNKLAGDLGSVYPLHPVTVIHEGL